MNLIFILGVEPDKLKEILVIKFILCSG